MKIVLLLMQFLQIMCPVLHPPSMNWIVIIFIANQMIQYWHIMKIHFENSFRKFISKNEAAVLSKQKKVLCPRRSQDDKSTCLIKLNALMYLIKRNVEYFKYYKNALIQTFLTFQVVFIRCMRE